MMADILCRIIEKLIYRVSFMKTKEKLRMSSNEVFAVSHHPGEITLKGFSFIKDKLPDEFEVCLIVEKNGDLSVGCWDTGVWSAENGKPGCFRQSIVSQIQGQRPI